MLPEIVRCPYCVQSGSFRPMFQRSRGSYLCLGCGHTANPEQPAAQCECSRCLAAIEVASRCRNGEETRRYTAADPSSVSYSFDEVSRY